MAPTTRAAHRGPLLSLPTGTQRRVPNQYRVTRATHQGPLLSLSAGVKKPKKTLGPATFECVICERKFRSRQWVKRHFNSHQTVPYNRATDRYLPAYTHPSCWPATEAFTWERQNAVLENKWYRAVAHPGSWGVEDAMQEVAALTPAENEVKQELRTLSLWWWWWKAQGRAIKRAIDNAGPGRLNIQGSASDVIGNRPHAANLNRSSDELQMRPANEYPASTAQDPRVAQEVALNDPGKPSTAETTRSYDEYYPRERGPGFGRLTTELDLSGHKPLMLNTVLQFVSTLNIDFLKTHGENHAACTTMAQAAMAFVSSLTPQSNIRALLHRHLQGRQTALVYNVQEDRLRLWGAVSKSTKEYFGARTEIPRRSQAERDLVQAMARYAGGLGAGPVQRRIQTYRDGPDDALDLWYDVQFGDSQR